LIMRLSLAVVLCGVLFFGVGRDVGAQDAKSVSLAPAEGEILLDGSIVAVTTPNSFILGVSAFTLPNGKTNALTPAKPKTITISPQTQIRVRGQAEPLLSVGDLKTGVRVLVIGPDAGSGAALTARQIAAWDSEANGAFQLSTLVRKGQPVVPPVPAEAAPVNPFPIGDFERNDGSLDPAWRPSPGTLPRIVTEENGNRYAQISSDDPKGWRLILTTVTVEPAWKTLKVAARLKVRNLKTGDLDWKTGRVWWQFTDDAGKVLEYGRGLMLSEDSDWKALNTTVAVPPGSTKMILQAGFSQATGVLGVDDIALEPNAPMESRYLRADFPEGTFEELDAQGVPKGWKPGKGQWKIIEENGNHYLRLSSDNPTLYVSMEGRFLLNPEWKAVSINARLRASNLKRKPDAKSWETARLGFQFENTRGERVGEWPATIELQSDTNWKVLGVKADIPLGAVYLRLSPLLQNTTGIFDVDEILVRPIQPERALLPVHEIKTGLPEGTFELRDEKGNPAGWQLEGAATQIIKEEDNNFLRLTNDDARGTVLLPIQFALKP
jgi:hypothetical protein